jgi:hypothetical protein
MLWGWLHPRRDSPVSRAYRGMAARCMEGRLHVSSALAPRCAIIDGLLKARAWIVMAFTAVMACTLLLASASAKELGRGPWLRLGGGSGVEAPWSVELSRSTGREGGRRPCFRVMSETSRLTACGSLEPYPLIVDKSDGEGAKEFTVLALAYRNEVRSVKLWLRGRQPRVVRLQALSMVVARRAHVHQFRYAILVFRGPFCLDRVVGLDSQGAVVDPGSASPCSG